MRGVLLVLLLPAACGSSSKPSPDSPNVSARYAGGVAAIRTYDDVDRLSGQLVTLEGRFDHIRGEHGILITDSDLRIYIPHFDLFRRGDDWLKYVGRRVSATGRLHTYTRDIPGYSGPSLEILGFAGPLP